MTSSQSKANLVDSRTAAAETTARLDRIPTGRFHVKLAGFVGTGTFFDGFDALSLAVILPIIITAFDLDLSTAGLIVSAGYLGQFVGALAIGWFSDRMGRKWAFIACLAIFGIFSIGCAFAWSGESLALFRVLQGIGLGAEVPVAATLINEYLGRKGRGKASIIYQSTFSWGLFFAPLVALLLTESLGPELGWRVLLGIGGIPIVIAVWATFSMPESARWLADKGRINEANRYVDAMEKDALARGKHLPEPEKTTLTPHTPFRLSEMFTGLYGRRSFVLGVTWFFSYFVVYGYSVWLPTIYVRVGGLPTSSSLTLTVILGAVQIGVIYLCAMVIERVGRKRLLLFGLAIATAGGMWGVVIVGYFGLTSWPYLFSAGLIVAIGVAVPASTLYLYTTELYPTRMRGFATSTASSLNRIASVISPFVIGALLGRTGGVGLIFGLFTISAVIAFSTLLFGGIETRGKKLEELSA